MNHLQPLQISLQLLVSIFSVNGVQQRINIWRSLDFFLSYEVVLILEEVGNYWCMQRRLHELPESFVCRTVLSIFFPGAARCVHATLVRNGRARPTTSLPPAVSQEDASFHHAQERIPCHHSERNIR